jgi:thiol:disulfide interchange protein
MKSIKFLVLASLLALGACKDNPPAATNNSTPAPNPAPASRIIYPDPSQAKADLSAALRSAAASHKRILLDFGGNWCPDCQLLDRYLNDAVNRQILDANFVPVHVNIGEMDANLEIAERYGIPLHKGVPALAVLDEHGALLYSQKSGEFEAMRRMDPAEVTKFLLQWKPLRAGCSAVMVNC